MQLKRLLLALTPMGAAAYFVGGGTFTSIGELLRWAEEPTRRVAVATASAPGKRDSLWRTKKTLLALMAIGAAAYFAGAGTFASFSAETTNAGSSIASGTLTMSDQVNTGTVCVSSAAPAANNVNPNCAAVLSLTNIAPGAFAGVALVTVKNTGSIDASNLFLYAPQVSTTLSAGISGTVTSLPISALVGGIAAGDHIVLTSGTHTQPAIVASAAAVAGATSLSIPSTALNFAYPSGTTVTDTDSNTAANNTDCYDQITSSPGTVGATKGTDLNFNSTTNNPFCGSVNIFVQETTGGLNYCWLGHGSSPQTSNGTCFAPISVPTASTLTHGVSYSAIPINAGSPLNGNVNSGDTIVVTSGGQVATFTANANAGFGATSISVNPQTTGAATFDFPAGSIVTDTTTLGALNTSSADLLTLTNFDTAHNISLGKLPLTPVTGNGVVDGPTNPVQLAHGASRTFEVGVYLRKPTGTNQNALQGLSSTFGLTWHIDQ